MACGWSPCGANGLTTWKSGIARTSEQWPNADYSLWPGCRLRRRVGGKDEVRLKCFERCFAEASDQQQVVKRSERKTVRRLHATLLAILDNLLSTFLADQRQRGEGCHIRRVRIDLVDDFVIPGPVRRWRIGDVGPIGRKLICE